MKKQFYIYSGLCALFFALAFWQESNNNKVNNLTQYAFQIQQTLHFQENEVQKVVAELSANPEYLRQADALQRSSINFNRLATQPFTILLYEGEKLLTWSNNKILVEPSINEGFQKINEVFYHVSKQELFNTLFIAVYPIKYKKQEHLESVFVADDCIPDQVEISHNSGIFELKSKNGYSAFLDAPNNASNSNIQYRSFILLSLGFLMLCFMVNHVAIELLKGKRPDYGLIFLFLSVGIIKALIIYLDFNTRFNLLPIFKYTLSQTIATAGDMLINIVLLLWMIVFFYRDSRQWDFSQVSVGKRLAMLFIFYLAIVFGLLITVAFHKNLILNGKDDFDFENVFYIELSNVITIMSLLLLWSVFFLFNYRIMKNVKRLELPISYRVGILVSVLLIVLPITLTVGELNLDIAILALFLFTMVMFIDFFVDNESSYFPWILTWLIVFSSASAIFLYKYKRDGDVEELKQTIEKLSFGEDTKAITRIDEVIAESQKGIDTLNDFSIIKDRLFKNFQKNDYLADNYRLEIADTLLRGSIGKARQLPVDDYNNCYSAQLKVDSSHFYRVEVFRLDNSRISDAEYNTSVLVEPYLGIKNYDKIDYAVFKNGICDDQKGNHYNSLSDLRFIPKEKQGAHLIWTPSESEVLQNRGNDTIIVARHRYDGRQKVAFLFAYLFIFLAGMTFIIAVLNTFMNFIDGFKFPRNWTINFKVHLTIIGLVIFACLVVACITIIYSTNSTEQRHRSQLYQKIEAVTNQTQSMMRDTALQKIDFQNITKSVTSVHEIDVNFYDLEGKLLNQTDKTIFKKKLKAPIINSIAFARLKNEYSFQLDDEVGNFKYKSGFSQVIKNDKVIAYMELPYYSREIIKQNDLSDLMGMLMTVYVLLLVPTIIFAYSTTKIIMKPLQEVGEKLREVEFGVTPTKIEWNSKDELGDLIREYNAMLVKLEESARQIKANAKESAWKVMARQVAHDIRNPLTPLKLNVQMLSMMSQSADYETLRSYIQKTTRSLEESINNMNNIANNFLDYSNNESLQLSVEEVEFCDFVELNASLYTTNEHPNAVVNIVTPPNRRIYVKMDRAQMSRVVNNLIKNAIQAIPDNREGRVDVFVYENGKKVVARVTDNGVGIPQDQMDKIFLPNFTTRGTGSGIGLAVSNRIVMDAEGHLWCESVLGQGSDFFIELPILYAE